MVCAARGYPFVATMVETFSVERRKIMPTRERSSRLPPSAAPAWCAGPRSWRANTAGSSHGSSRTKPTLPPADDGPEILRDFAGRRLDYWSPAGHGRHDDRAEEVIARPPRREDHRDRTGRRILLGGRNGSRTRSRAGRRTSCRTLNPEVYDELVTRMTTRPRRRPYAPRARKASSSYPSGATLAAGLKVRRNEPLVPLVMLPDTGERYLSTYLLKAY